MGRKTTEPDEQHMAYALLTELAGVDKEEAKTAAGFPETALVPNIDRHAATKLARKSVAEQRELIQKHMPGFSFTDMVNRIVGRATDEAVDPRVQTQNDKLLSEVMGFNSPKEVNVNTTSLIMEFSQLSGTDIEAILAEDADFEEVEEEDKADEDQVINDLLFGESK
jgi:hypothetical protein